MKTSWSPRLGGEPFISHRICQMMGSRSPSTFSAHDDLYVSIRGQGVGRVACCAWQQFHLVMWWFRQFTPDSSGDVGTFYEVWGTCNRGGLVIDVDDSHPLEFPKIAMRPRPRAICWAYIYKARVLYFYWVNGLGVCRTLINLINCGWMNKRERG